MITEILKDAADPVGTLGRFSKLVGATAPLGYLYYLHKATAAPKIDKDALLDQVKQFEPGLARYPADRVDDYYSLLLEYDPDLSQKPRILGKILLRLIPYPTFPYEELGRIKDIFGKDITGQMSAKFKSSKDFGAISGSIADAIGMFV